LTLQKNCEHS